MGAGILDGAAVAAQVRAELTERVREMVKTTGVRPGLGTILVGDNPASAAYVRLKHQDCAEVGIASFGEHLPADTTEEQLHDVIARYNANPEIDGFLVQTPLPPQLDEGAALMAVDPSKDVDGLHPTNLGKLVQGEPGPISCTPAGIQELLVRHGVEISGRHVVIIGRGLTIGRPLALLLALKRPHANAAVTVVHTGVADPAALCRQADILIAAAGSPGLVKPDWVKPGAAVVGAGVTMDGKRIISDLDEGVAEVAGWITPRVGGVGPMTRAMLLKNTVDLAGARAGS
jgi:methylenetetrahydrofolate dehydrogenase (NADP+)/methenyltetrahydrofolate cyclohydrolase